LPLRIWALVFLAPYTTAQCVYAGWSVSKEEEPTSSDTAPADRLGNALNVFLASRDTPPEKPPSRLDVEEALSLQCLELIGPYLDPFSIHQQDLTSAGNEVLRSWPWPLRGLNYRFHVLRGETVAGIACSKGDIAVSEQAIRGLSRQELTALLAHEIAHVEFEHDVAESLHSYWVRLATEANARMWGRLLRRAQQKAGRDPDGATKAAETLEKSLELFPFIFSYTHTFRHEREADWAALFYCQSAHGSPAALASMLKMLADETTDPKGATLLMTHAQTVARHKSMDTVIAAPLGGAVTLGACRVTFQNQALLEYQIIESLRAQRPARGDSTRMINYYPKEFDSEEKLLIMATFEGTLPNADTLQVYAGNQTQAFTFSMKNPATGAAILVSGPEPPRLFHSAIDSARAIVAELDSTKANMQEMIRRARGIGAQRDH
jgi:hypothetical protein